MNSAGGSRRIVRLSEGCEPVVELMFGEPRRILSDFIYALKFNRDAFLFEADKEIPDSAPTEVKNCLACNLGRSFRIGIVVDEERREGILIRWFENRRGEQIIYEIKYPAKLLPED